MKRRYLLLMSAIFALTMTIRCEAQSAYFIFKVANSFAGNEQQLQSIPLERNNQTYTVGTYGSYASGISFQAGIGKMLNPTFGFEISGEFANGWWRKTNVDESNDNFGLSGYAREKANTVLIKPVIVIRNSGDLLSIYTKLGMVFAPYIRKYGHVEITESDYATGEHTFLQLKSVESAKLKLGFTACFGVAVRMSESVSLSGEVSGQIMSLPIKKGRYTTFKENGKDILSVASVSDKEWVYKKAGFFDASSDPGIPSERLYNPANYTAIGIAICLVYHL